MSKIKVKDMNHKQLYENFCDKVDYNCSLCLLSHNDECYKYLKEVIENREEIEVEINE